MRLPRTLRTASFRLAALYVLLFAASVLVLGAVVFWTARGALVQQMRARIATESSLLAGEYPALGLDGIAAAIRRRERGVGALDYRLQSAAGARLAGELPPVSRPGWQTLGVREQPDGADQPERSQALVAALPDGGLLAVGDDLSRLTDVEEAILTALAWAVGLMAVLGIGGGVLLSRGFLHRVDGIARTAEAIIGGDLARRVPVRGAGDDLDRLAATLNRMLDRIESLMENLRQVSNDIAHDLRTPLSRLLQRLEAARAHAGSEAEYARAVDGAAAEAQAILETFGALLRIAQVEAGTARDGFRPVDLGALVETVVEAFAPSAEEDGHRLTGQTARDVVIQGDRELLAQLLVNLVENALRHTPPGTPVAVALAGRPGSGMRLTVTDRGPGVPEAERRHVLRRFYRGERSRTTPGDGLGLSLVAAVAELHGASLSLEDARPGLRAVVSFAPVPAAVHAPARQASTRTHRIGPTPPGGQSAELPSSAAALRRSHSSTNAASGRST